MCLVDIFNNIYNIGGFDGVISYVENRLEYGYVERKTDDLVLITTGGWSDDEDLIHCLIHICCRFGEKHYVGYLRGGAYYFSRYDKEYDLIEAKLITRW